MYPVTRDRQIKFRPGWDARDFLIILAIITILLVIVRTAAKFGGAYDPDFQISTSPAVLPSYTAQTLLRMAAAYLISLVFTLIYAYSAYKSRVAAIILLPLLDILQSIPVLSFLPGVVLALIAIFPGARLGIELAAILLIFTGMTWNMTFSFYQSLQGIPWELREAASIYRLNLWQRFWQLELPAGAIGLVWNSVMSVAGGWFFLMAIESFTLEKKDFRLPGLGSYLRSASEQGNMEAICWGLAVLISVIIVLDFLIWQPLIAWAEKFKFETVEAQNPPQSKVLYFLRRSPTIKAISLWVESLQNRSDRLIALALPFDTGSRRSAYRTPLADWLNRSFFVVIGLVVLWGTWEALLLIQVLQWQDWQKVFLGTVFTTLRVFTAMVLSLIWTVPVGVAIGRNPRLAQILQPIVQIAASVPATAIFPIVLIGLAQIGGGLQVGSIALMMLGTMWYILFNAIAGAQSIPSELFEAAKVYKLNLIQRWRTLILPGIFPYLITGIITAVGGAWNASIVSEYVQFQNQTITTPGLGSTISEATDAGNFPLLMAATAVMSLLVVMTNRLVWRPLYRIASDKYRIML